MHQDALYAFYSSIIVKYKLETLTLYLSIVIFCFFLLLLHYISTQTFTLHLADNCCYFWHNSVKLKWK